MDLRLYTALTLIFCLVIQQCDTYKANHNIREENSDTSSNEENEEGSEESEIEDGEDEKPSTNDARQGWEIEDGEGEGPSSPEEERLNNVDEYGDKAEGDIADRPEDFLTEKSPKARNAIGMAFMRTFLWPYGVIPYSFDRLRPLTDFSKKQVEEALKKIEDATKIKNTKCIEFRPRKTEKDYLLFTRKDGCWSRVAKRGGAQDVSIGIGCTRVGTIMHEMLHALGFYHEQSRIDRDKYLDIKWTNIASGYTNNFDKYNLAYASTLGKPYDFGSIMHYGPYAFAKVRGLKTLQAKTNPKLYFGQRTHLSPNDIEEIRVLYNCYSRASKVKLSSIDSKEEVPSSNEKKDRKLSSIDSKEEVPSSNEKKDRNKSKAQVKTAKASKATKVSKVSKESIANSREDSDEICGVVECNFKKDLEGCRLEDGDNDDFDWSFGLETPSAYTGPLKGDKTCKNKQAGLSSKECKFAFIEASGHTNKKARLETRKQSEGTYCVRFACNMYGSMIGDLRVITVNSRGDEVGQHWKKSGNLGTSWKETEVEVRVGKQQKIVFEAKVGIGYKSDIALDDICITKGSC
ncbi:unnamed protein product [Owenia fusiformis]|uniref:Metalloendopeptidase n=1 Tax=Owenia fusiformis TaxID=6347 RepID=A0A8J1Y645_OWEFU|nr:unnamed protein product [Owenia fusiformis]